MHGPPHPIWVLMHPGMTPEHLGIIPYFLETKDERPAAKQFNERYAHGGGWRPMPGFQMSKNNILKSNFSEDPTLEPVACCMLRDELVMLYPHDLVAVVQKNGAFEVARMD